MIHMRSLLYKNQVALSSKGGGGGGGGGGRGGRVFSTDITMQVIL